jgi:ATP-dependent Lhr-like helicase
MAQQLLARHGIVTREAVASENVAGGFGVIYPVLKALEENGRVRRGYFVAGLGATQFALPGALDLLRSMRDTPEEPEVAVMAATDPANPYGATLKWPASAAYASAAREAHVLADAAPTRHARGSSGARSAAPGGDGGSASHTRSRGDAGSAVRGPTRTVGATVILVDGAMTAYLARGDRQLVTWLPDTEPQRSRAARAVAHVLIERARSGGDAPRGMLIEEVDGGPAGTHPVAPFLIAAGFVSGALGMQATFPRVAPRDAKPEQVPVADY